MIKFLTVIQKDCLVWVYFKLYKMAIIMVEIFQDFLFSLKTALLKFIHITSYNYNLLFHIMAILQFIYPFLDDGHLRGFFPPVFAIKNYIA